jgi:dienelactone hydrolase
MEQDPREIVTAEVFLGDKTDEGFRPVDIETSRGVTSTRWYFAPDSNVGVVYVGGVGGGFDSPAHDLYPRLCREFAAGGVHGLRVRFRNAVDLDEAAFDVMAGVAFMESQGVERLGFVGHSFGGAVVIRAATVAPSARTVVAISTQGHGAEVVTEMAENVSLLLLHGEGDQVLPPSMSEFVYSRAHEPKELRIIPEGSHVLDEVSEAVHEEVHDWLARELLR